MLNKKLQILPSQLLSFMTLFCLGLIGTVVVLMLFLSSQSFEDLPSISTSSREKVNFPKNPFAQAAEAYEQIGQGPFELQWIAPQMQLPDLRKEIVYLGRNERPDVPKGHALFHIGLKNRGECATVRNGEQIFLIYQGSFSLKTCPPHRLNEQAPLWSEPQHQIAKGNYAFSPGNQPTPLWLEVRLLDEDTLNVTVGMLDEKGSLVTTPEDSRCFPLVKSDYNKISQVPWEIGGQRVDTTLLVRQKARWVGPDLFLEKHGGEEYAFAEESQRIDFMEDPPSSCFVKVGDFLIWDEDHWKVATHADNTLGIPLLVVRKIDDKVMVLDLWDAEGKTKFVLSLIRMRDYDPFPEVANEFKFVGAKTWAQFIVECHSQRLLLKPHDWLLLTKDGWSKISTPEEVDDFVNQKITGPLFILDKMTKQNGRQVLIGHLFNSTRTEMMEVELPAVQSPLSNSYAPSLALPPPLKDDAIQENRGEQR